VRLGTGGESVGGRPWKIHAVLLGFYLQLKTQFGGPERKEFELKPTFPLRLFLRFPRPPHCISASPRKRFTSTNSGSLNTLALVDPLIVDQGPEGSSSSLQWWRRGESNPRPKSATPRSLHAYLSSLGFASRD
jgi:hypothetical protein